MCSPEENLSENDVSFETRRQLIEAMYKFIDEKVVAKVNRIKAIARIYKESTVIQICKTCKQEIKD